MEKFLVGGMVRDEIMGHKSKDADFVVVLSDSDFPTSGTTVSEPDPFDIMRKNLVAEGFKIFVESPQYHTIRAQFPKGDNSFGVRDADFVLARKEGPYSDGRRPDWVKPGTLLDDLSRRDFTLNAIAKAADGNYIDPFNGQRDIAMGIISAVGDPTERLREDALRAVRALRFMVTKNMQVDPGLRFAMQTESVLHSIRTQIADERIKDELAKMLAVDTVKSIQLFNAFPQLTEAMFSGSVSLTSTMKGGRKVSKPNLPTAHNGCTCHCHTTPGVMHMTACCRPSKG